MVAHKESIWILIPARGGSKTIPRKNLVQVGDRPLIDFVCSTASRVSGIDNVLGSSDSPEIQAVFRQYGFSTPSRPSFLSLDDSKVDDLARFLIADGGSSPPDILVLMQPTSPFVTVEQVSSLIDLLVSDQGAASAQTVARVPHNAHEWNQRVVDGATVRFAHKEEREQAFRKQLKPERYTFGNVVAVRSQILLEGQSFFAEPSLGLEIPRLSALDVDGPEDLLLAGLLAGTWDPVKSPAWASGR